MYQVCNQEPADQLEGMYFYCLCLTLYAMVIEFHEDQIFNFPVAASSICNTHDSVSIPSNPDYTRVFVASYPAKNLR